jgi:integrase
MNFDVTRKRFEVRNPVTGKKQRFADEATARAAALVLGQWLEQERAVRALDTGRPIIATLVADWIRDRRQHQPWDEGTWRNYRAMFGRVTRDLGERLIVKTTNRELEQWLSGFVVGAGQWNKWRHLLVLLWKFAYSRNLASEVWPERIELRSLSKKIPANRKRRRQLTLEQFQAIHAKAEPWLQLAMELSLVTLQARNEVCNMRHDQFRDGHLFVIRDKVSGDSDMAFIKIPVTRQLEELRQRALCLGVVASEASRALAPRCEQAAALADQGVPVAEIAKRFDSTPKAIGQLIWWQRRHRGPRVNVPIASPYLIHRTPSKRIARQMKAKAHWTHVEPNYLSQAFAEATVAAGIDLPAKVRPTFHEIRGLGGRLYRKQGMSHEAVQALMTHSTPKTTAIYLERGADALTAEDYVTVSAPMQLAKVLG